MTADEKIAAFETLLAEVSGAMADLVQCAQDRQASASEISTALVDMLGVFEARQSAPAGQSTPLSSLIAALEGFRQPTPQVTFNPVIEVSPTPITNVVHVPAPVVQVHEREACDFLLTPTYGRGGQITEMAIRRIPAT